MDKAVINARNTHKTLFITSEIYKISAPINLFRMRNILKYIILILGFIICSVTVAQKTNSAQNRWNTESIGNITWKIGSNLPHYDNIEMSGLKVSAIIDYGVNADSSFSIKRKIVWPMLRIIPNDTRGTLIRSFNVNVLDWIKIDGKPIRTEKVEIIKLNGLISVKSKLNSTIEFTRILYPTVKLPVYCENYKLINSGKKKIILEIPSLESRYTTEPSKGVDGSYTVETKTTKSGAFSIESGDSIQFGLIFDAYKQTERSPDVNLIDELKARENLVSQWQQNLVLETPNETLNNAFAFAKIRASESIFDTKAGLMHSPGGEEYYAGIWANDQAEYIPPFFPFLGYEIGNKSALNTYMLFARYMNKDYKPIPSSIVAEGDSYWNGVGDRGDQAMIAYGACRYALALSDKSVAKKLWPLVEWCLEYLKRNVNDKGVVKSDADELERRFPAGDANLCTSTLYYDALISANYLGKELDKPVAQLNNYLSRAKILKSAIENHFGANIDGFNTYRYYEGNTVLRSWICMPLTVGIYERKQGTIAALFSPQLWTDDGLATQAGDKTFWDRSTLYALRGAFASGEKEKALNFLEFYSNRRLLGEHVPYAVEAYPEGNQRHLSTESALYCRIFTEGMFGIRPTGFKSFNITPQLPEKWNSMTLKNIHAFSNVFDIQIKRVVDKIQINIVSVNKLLFSKIASESETIKVIL